MSDPTPKRRWFHPTPSWLIVGLLALECVLWLSERFQWFSFNQHKGWTVLIAVAVVGATMLLMLLWLAVALVFYLRFQFSVRSLLILTVAVAIPCSWLAVEMKAARRQKETIEAILKVKGIAWYEWQVDVEHYYNPLPKAQPPDPAWLRSLLGNDFCWSVKRVGLESYESKSCNIADAGLENLKGLKQLEHLSFWGNQLITDAGLEHIEGMDQLRELWLNSTPITDAGLKHLKGLHQLRKLALEYINVTDDGLDSLKGLHHLRNLFLVGTKVTDAGVKKLQQALPKCEIQYR